MHRLLWATPIVVACAALVSSPVYGQSKDKVVKVHELLGTQSERVVTVSRIVDLDDITVRLGDKVTRVRLASVAPFHEWPVAQNPAWVKTQEQLQRRAINQLERKEFHMRLANCQEEGKFPAVYLDARVDQQIDSESSWVGLKPAERTGWARTSQNIDLVYEGITIYRPDCQDRPYDLEKLFERAQQNAEVFRRGLWKDFRLARAVESTDTKVRH